MLKLKSVIATNDVITLADGTHERLADCAIEGMATQINEEGGRPQLIEHDWLRPSGWVNRAWTERNGSQLRLVVESIVPENSDEFNLIMPRFHRYLAALAAERTKPFIEFASGIQHPNIEFTIDTDCVYLHAPGLAEKLCPSEFAKRDEDGLIPLRSLTVEKPGVLRSGNYLLAPSMLLRPGFGLPNAPNRLLIAALTELASENDNCDVRLALDPDLVGIPQSLKYTEQRDFWWGPPYRGNPSSQPYGVTVHGPTQYDDLNGLIRTEFWWYGNEERTFEMEELATPARHNVHRQSVQGMRFVHSIFRKGSSDARHLDGAIRFYTNDLWRVRMGPNSNISNFGKRAQRIKVWRVDGELRTDMWYHLIHMFYRGNFTVAEYFGLPNPEIYRSTLGTSRNTG